MTPDLMDQQQKIDDKDHEKKRECPACGCRKFVATKDGMKCTGCTFRSLKEQRGKQIVVDKTHFKTFEGD